MRKMCFIFIVLLTAGCAAAFGNSITKVAVVRNGGVFKVIYKNPTESVVKVTILDAGANPIFAEKIISNGEFIRPYDLSQLPKGDYKICVDDQNGTHEEKLCNTESPVDFADRVIAESLLTAHVLKIRGADNKFLVAIPRQHEAEAEIHVYDQQDHLVYSERLKLDSDFAKVYALQNLEGASIGITGQFSGKEKLFRIE